MKKIVKRIIAFLSAATITASGAMGINFETAKFSKHIINDSISLIAKAAEQAEEDNKVEASVVIKSDKDDPDYGDNSHIFYYTGRSIGVASKVSISDVRVGDKEIDPRDYRVDYDDTGEIGKHTITISYDGYESYTIGYYVLINLDNVKVSPIQTQYYYGHSVEPTAEEFDDHIKLYDPNGRNVIAINKNQDDEYDSLKRNVDYKLDNSDISYADNTHRGYATATLNLSEVYGRSISSGNSISITSRFQIEYGDININNKNVDNSINTNEGKISVHNILNLKSDDGTSNDLNEIDNDDADTGAENNVKVITDDEQTHSGRKLKDNDVIYVDDFEKKYVTIYAEGLDPSLLYDDWIEMYFSTPNGDKAPIECGINSKPIDSKSDPTKGGFFTPYGNDGTKAYQNYKNTTVVSCWFRIPSRSEAIDAGSNNAVRGEQSRNFKLRFVSCDSKWNKEYNIIVLPKTDGIKVDYKKYFNYNENQGQTDTSVFDYYKSGFNIETDKFYSTYDSFLPPIYASIGNVIDLNVSGYHNYQKYCEQAYGVSLTNTEIEDNLPDPADKYYYSIESSVDGIANFLDRNDNILQLKDSREDPNIPYTVYNNGDQLSTNWGIDADNKNHDLLRIQVNKPGTLRIKVTAYDPNNAKVRNFEEYSVYINVVDTNHIEKGMKSDYIKGITESDIDDMKINDKDGNDIYKSASENKLVDTSGNRIRFNENYELELMKGQKVMLRINHSTVKQDNPDKGVDPTDILHWTSSNENIVSMAFNNDDYRYRNSSTLLSKFIEGKGVVSPHTYSSDIITISADEVGTSTIKAQCYLMNQDGKYLREDGSENYSTEIKVKVVSHADSISINGDNVRTSMNRKTPNISSKNLYINPQNVSSESVWTVFNPENANDFVEWKSDNSSIARVEELPSSRGSSKSVANIIPVGNGTCTITATTYRDGVPTQIHDSITVTVSRGSNIIGDVDNDGSVTAKDATKILVDYANRIMYGRPSSLNATIADVNSDGTIDAKDATIILRYYAESLIPSSGISGMGIDEWMQMY